MKNESSKTKLSLISWLTIALTAFACLLVIISIFVVVVGAGIVYYKVARTLTSLSTNINQTQLYYATTVENQVQIPVNNKIIQSLETGTSNKKFTLHYGISILSESLGTNYSISVNPLPGYGEIPIGNASSVTVLINTPQEYAFSVIEPNGQTFTYDYNAQTGQLYNMFTTNAIVIERSTDLMNWNSIFTNEQCGVGVDNIFTDSNAPQNAAFYRLSAKFN